MKDNDTNRPSRWRLWVAASTLLSTACGGDGTDRSAEISGEGRVYALQTMVYQPDDTVMAYVALTDTLDVSDVSLKSAREFPSYAWSRTTVYEIASDGTAREHLEVEGVVNNWIRVR